MDHDRLARIRASFELFEPCGPALIARVVLRLAKRHPGSHALFTTGDVAQQNQRLWMTFQDIVARLHRFHELELPLMKLGARAALGGVRGVHYAAIRGELIDTMSELAGPDWSPALHEDWDLVLSAVCGAMIRGAMHAGAEARRKAA